MSLILRDPFRELDNFHERLTDLFSATNNAGESSQPAINMYEKDGELRVDVVVPNFKPDEVDVNITSDRLEITAEHRDESEDNSARYYRREASWQRLYRQVILPKKVDVENAKASHDNGVIKVALPLAQGVEPRKLEITSN